MTVIAGEEELPELEVGVKGKRCDVNISSLIQTESIQSSQIAKRNHSRQLISVMFYCVSDGHDMTRTCLTERIS